MYLYLLRPYRTQTYICQFGANFIPKYQNHDSAWKIGNKALQHQYSRVCQRFEGAERFHLKVCHFEMTHFTAVA